VQPVRCQEIARALRELRAAKAVRREDQREGDLLIIIGRRVRIDEGAGARRPAPATEPQVR
jgi:hypothetical protein